MMDISHQILIFKERKKNNLVAFDFVSVSRTRSCVASCLCLIYFRFNLVALTRVVII